MRAHADSELISRIKGGDETALSELLRAYGVRLLKVAAPIAGSDDLAQDVVQDVFIKLWDNRSTLDIRTSVAAYLYRAVRNCALDVRKHERVQQRLEERVYADSGGAEPAVLNDHEASLQQGDISRAIESALASLPERMREVFLLRADHGLSSAEVAQTLGIATASVHVQMYRATKLLAQKLALWGKSRG